MSRRLLLALLLVTAFSLSTALGQKSFLSDYALEQVKDIPEEKQDSFYLVQGKYYYAFYTRESYRKSMECYLEALKLAIEYQHPNVILKCYFGIGAVYDANNNLQQAIRYYKQYYDGILKERPFNAKNILRASFNIASTYAKAKDTANALQYSLKMAEMLPWLKKDSVAYNQYCLLIAHNFIEIGRNVEFQEYFHMITPKSAFEDGELALGRLFAEAKSKNALLLGMKDSVIPPILFELSRTRDSIPLLNLLLTSYAAIGDYKKAYECQELMIDADVRSMDKNTYGDINYRLLEADNLLRQKKNSELLLTSQQLRFKTSLLYVATFMLALGLLATWFLFRRYKIKNRMKDRETVLIKQHQESNHHLLKELHSGINESLKVWSDSLDSQFQTIGHSPDELKREIKAGLNCIAIAHAVLERYDAINQVTLQPYFESLTRETFEIFEVEAVLVDWKIEMLTSQMDVVKLIPLAFGIVELLKHTIKNTLGISKQVEIEIQCRLMDGEYHLTYKELGFVEPEYDSNVITKMDTKLLYDFLRQINAKVLIDDDKIGQHEVLIVFVK
jgi:two-component sensor histidine kinase